VAITTAFAYGVATHAARLLGALAAHNCFLPDTLVATESGMRQIQHIEPGDRVWSYDFEKGEWRLATVEHRYDSEYNGPVVTIVVGDSRITCTARHPFWVIQGNDLENRPGFRELDVKEDRGLSLPGRWVNSHDLCEGDIVFLRDAGPVAIRQVLHRQAQTPVCEMTIRDLHTFSVGRSGVLVHNVGESYGSLSQADQLRIHAYRTQMTADAAQAQAMGLDALADARQMLANDLGEVIAGEKLISSDLLETIRLLFP
jgi:hypothetical protein